MEKIKHVRLTPERSLEILSQLEVAHMAKNTSKSYELFRRCALAVLKTDDETDDTEEILERYHDFRISVIQQERGVKLELHNVPATAFVDGEMLTGIKEHLFSVLRDLVYTRNVLIKNDMLDLDSSAGITDAVFQITRNADILHQNYQGNFIVCWGGHSINHVEYEYTKRVGYQLGLRGIDIGTGCGPGAMKGPMKGAAIAHAKQRLQGRYIGITEPGIIAAESPNPIVNHLVILPDIEKRLEAFVRLAHGIVVFPGGAGTAEEILYLLGILLDPENEDVFLPLIFTGPKESKEYFEKIDDFIGTTLGPKAQSLYRIIIEDPEDVAVTLKNDLELVRISRREKQDAYYYNWVLKINEDLQHPFNPTHESMRDLNLERNQPPHQLAANLRKAFSGIVSGNVKVDGIKAVKEKGPYEISGDQDIIAPLGDLLESFVKQNRMKINTTKYVPCYKIV